MPTHNTLICLLSDQHMPNLVSVHHFKPARLVLVVTPETKKRHLDYFFEKALIAGELSYGDQCETIELPSAVAFNKIKESFAVLRAQLWESGEIIINLTGGTKPMSIMLHEVFRDTAKRAVYIDVATPDQIYDVMENRFETSKYRPSIAAFLAGHGFRFDESRSALARQRKAKQLDGLATLIAQRQVEGSLLHLGGSKLTTDTRYKLINNGESIELKKHELVIADNQLRNAIAKYFNLQVAETSLIGEISAHGFNFLMYGWLEVFIWSRLRQHEVKLGISDVSLSRQIFDYRQGPDAEPALLNEFDVTFMREHTLHVVECKTGAQSEDKKVDALYKLEAVIKQFGALRVNSLFASTSSNILNQKGKVKPGVIARAKALRCQLMPRSTISAIAAAPDDIAPLSKALGFVV